MSPCPRIAAALLSFALLASPPSQAGDLIYTASFDEAPEGPYNDYEAARFLTQATFGPTLPEIRRLRQMGYNAWLNEQFALPFSTHRPYLDYIASLPEDPGPNPNMPDPDYSYENEPSNDKRNMAFVERAMHAPDQLRQRLAFALSEIFVVSDQGGGLGGEPYALAHYYDQLGEHGFGTYRNLLERVTLSPIMGRYLSMLGNRKPNPAINLRPDENYAREIMQLFSVGLVQLNQDGSAVDGDPMTAGTQTISTYNQDTIRGFAHVFTGWNFSGCTVSSFSWCGAGETGAAWFQSMIAPEGVMDGQYTMWHAYTGDKQLLIYPGATPANGLLVGAPEPTSAANSPTPYPAITAALNNIANHPNVGPFISKHLIQRFVTSNPESDYVARVSSVFANNGSGVRGDLRAVLRAILMDPDARAKPVVASPQGKLREPFLRLTQLWRAFNATDPSGRYNDWYMRWTDGTIAQAPLHSPTVFNFFLPDYAPPGEIATAGLHAPEFQIQTDGNVTRLSDILYDVVRSMSGSPYLDPDTYVTNRYTQIHVEGERALRSDANLERMLERIDILMMSGSMSAHMRTTLRTYLLAISANEDNGYRRVHEALWLTMISPEYVIEK